MNVLETSHKVMIRSCSPVLQEDKAFCFFPSSKLQHENERGVQNTFHLHVPIQNCIFPW